MSENSSSTPIDLSAFDNLDPVPAPSKAITAVPAGQPQISVNTDERLLPQPRLERLVQVASLTPEDLTLANRSAANLDFRNTNTLLAMVCLPELPRPPASS
jgi:hypothetical protein